MKKFIGKIAELEAYSPDLYAEKQNADFGVLYYTNDFTDFYDGNHAVITNFTNIEATISEIIDFYKSKEITPRIYSKWDLKSKDILYNILISQGFYFDEYKTSIMIYNGNKITPKIQNLVFKRVENIAPEICEIFILENKGSKESVYRRSKLLNVKNHYFYAGYLGDKPVTVGAIEINKNHIARIVDIVTHPHYRNKGYASELIEYLINFTLTLKPEFIYLETDNEIAEKIYAKKGFARIIDNYECWVAWKNLN